MELQARADCGRVAADGSESHYVTLSFVAPPAETTGERPPVRLGLALDRSGSMNGRKFELARRAVETSLGMLRETDCFALVVFDHEVTTLAALTPATAEARQRALQALAAISARGNTNLSGGWLRAAEELGCDRSPDDVARVILLTDGQANQGITDEAELWGHAARLRGAGITTSAIGLGRDFNERLLEGITDQGGGHSYYVENAAQLPDVLAGETGETLQVVLRSAHVDVAVPAGATVTLLEQIGCAATQGGLRVQLGDLTAGQLVRLSFEATLPASTPGETIALGFALYAAGTEQPLASTSMRWQYDTAAAAAAAPRNEETQARVATVLEARARHEALAHNRAGRFDEARRAMLAMVEKLQRLGAGSERVREFALRLGEDAELHAEQMGADDMKRRHFAAHYSTRGRDESGKSRKGRIE